MISQCEILLSTDIYSIKWFGLIEGEKMMESMNQWWDSLDLSLQVFYGIGGLALFAVFIQTLLTMFSGGVDGSSVDDSVLHADHAAMHSDQGSGSTMHYLSFRGLTAFFMGFGWTGAICIRLGMIPLLAALVGVAVGLVIEFAFLMMMKQFSRLQSDGTFKLEKAIGGVGTVYLTVPPKGNGTGEVIVKAAGRAVHCKAFNSSETAIKAGAEVNIKALQGTGVLVAPLNVSE